MFDSMGEIRDSYIQSFRDHPEPTDPLALRWPLMAIGELGGTGPFTVERVYFAPAYAAPAAESTLPTVVVQLADGAPTGRVEIRRGSPTGTLLAATDIEPGFDPKHLAYTSAVGRDGRATIYVMYNSRPILDFTGE
jgi:hypothetical protein